MELVACQRDARLRSLDVEVMSCEHRGDAYDVVLSDTVLYPEGGGQPADRGTVRGVDVHHVFKRGNAVIHRTREPVAPGPATVVVDWDRRFDHMQQHSGQHLLTAICQDRFGWATTSFHLHAERSDIELDTPDVTADALAAVEDHVAEAIRAALPVRVTVVAADEVPDGVRTRGLPDGLDVLRLVRIGDLDLNTCGGTHVAHTGELETLKIVGTERLRGGVRLHFLVGGRVRRALGDALAREEALTAVLSAPAVDHVATSIRLADEVKAVGKRLRALGAELAELRAEELARAPSSVASLHLDDGDVALLNRIASAALARRDDLVLLLTAGAQEGVFLLAGPPARVEAARERVLAALDARGGGRPGRVQGKAARLDRRQDAVDAL